MEGQLSRANLITRRRLCGRSVEVPDGLFTASSFFDPLRADGRHNCYSIPVLDRSTNVLVDEARVGKFQKPHRYRLRVAGWQL